MEKILADLKKGIVAPCYLLYGDEEYLISENLNKIIAAIVPEADRDFSLFEFDGEDTDIDSLVKSVQSPSLLGNRKAVIVKNSSLFSSRQNAADIIKKIFSNLEENPAKASKYFTAFLKITGFSLEDLQNDEWKKISEEQWREAVESAGTWEERENWLPRILEIHAAENLKASSDTADAEEMEEIVKKAAAAGNCIIFTATTVDQRKKSFKTIAEMGVVIDFNKTRKAVTQKNILAKETQSLLQKAGKEMSPGAWRKLGGKTGWELRPSIMELEKLIFFVGERQIIEEKDVQEIVGKTKEDGIFALTNALSEKNQLAALETLKNLLDQGNHHLQILTMIIREIRLLLQARILVDSGKLPKFTSSMDYGWFQKIMYPAFTRLGTSALKGENIIFSQKPYPIYNALRNCVHFSYSGLVTLLNELLKIDLTFKSSAADPQILLEKFLINACAIN